MSFKNFFILLGSLVVISCGTTENIAPNVSKDLSQNVESTKIPISNNSISLLFAGDIMAHAPNFKAGNFDRIWVDVKDVISSADLAFGNVEAPVMQSRDWSTYPEFNMHHDYIEAAIEAGFDVFSLANNHTNDQLKDGIIETRKYFDSLKKDGIYSCGVKLNSKDPLTYQIIEKNGFKILFVAVTQVLNRPDFASWIDYYPSTESKKKVLKTDLKNIYDLNPCDLFVLSIHCDEAEYVLSVPESQKIFYKEIISECNVDVIWANHPHVVQEWEIIENEKSKSQSLIMYANGNTISAQRTNPQFTKPETPRDFTGDGLFVKVLIEKSNNSKIKINALEPIFITTYKTPTGQYVIRKLDDDLIHCLERAELTQWSKYLSERKKIMLKTKGPRLWQ